MTHRRVSIQLELDLLRQLGQLGAGVLQQTDVLEGRGSSAAVLKREENIVGRFPVSGDVDVRLNNRFACEKR